MYVRMFTAANAHLCYFCRLYDHRQSAALQSAVSEGRTEHFADLHSPTAASSDAAHMNQEHFEIHPCHL